MSVKLFVGGLSFSTSSERLREAFARFGGVDSAAVMTDRETGRSRGFGFVEMSTAEAAEQAIGALNGSSLDGRTIRVDKATPRGSAPPRPAGDRRPGGPPRSYGDRPSGAGGGGFARPDRPAGRSDRGPAGPPPRGAGDPWRPPSSDSRRGPGGQRRGGPDRGYGERKGTGIKRGPGMQRRSNDRGRRSLGDEGGYRPF